MQVLGTHKKEGSDMVEAMLLMKWDERAGAEKWAAVPESADIDMKTLMQLYTVHQYSAKRGFVSLNQNQVNYASYYSGPEQNLFLILILTHIENPDEYESILSDCLTELDGIPRRQDKIKKIPEMFKTVKSFKDLTLEQKLAKILFDPVTYAVISRLRKELVIEESDLELWLKDTYPIYTIDMEKVAQTLLANEFIKISSVKGHPGRFWFLVRDIIVLLKPPAKLYKKLTPEMLPPALKDAYYNSVQQFFSGYGLNEEKNIRTVQRIFNSVENYNMLTFLRERAINQNDCAKLEADSVFIDTGGALRDLYNQKLVGTFKDEKDLEYYCLIADIFVGQYFPLHLLNLAIDLYQKHVQEPKVLAKALDFLKEEYYLRFSKKKRNAENKPVKDRNEITERNDSMDLGMIEQMIKGGAQ
jgi:hypothetical protein